MRNKATQIQYFNNQGDERYPVYLNYGNGRMRYCFVLEYFRYPQFATTGDELEFIWCVDNKGVESIYSSAPVKIRLLNENRSYTFDVDVDTRKWFTGKNVNRIFVKLPENMEGGKYEIQMGVMGENIPIMVTEAIMDGAFYIVGNMEVEEENPLDKMASNGGLTRIFRTIGCIGDSLSSGEFQVKNQAGEWDYYDMYEYSWGQHIARMTGSKVYNFSRGGMSAKTYWQDFADKNRFWSPEMACQAYIIALGVNDLRGNEAGCIEDIDFNDYRNNKDTFAGYYGAIIQRLKGIQPRAKFFLVTIPLGHNYLEHEIGDKHRELLMQMTEKFDNTYLIDLRAYAPVNSDYFQEMYWLNRHLNPAGYIQSAEMIVSYIDYIIRHNIKDFDEVGFIGTSITDHKDA